MLLHALQVFQGIHTSDGNVVGDHHAYGVAMPQNPQLFEFFNLLQRRRLHLVIAGQELCAVAINTDVTQHRRQFVVCALQNGRNVIAWKWNGRMS